MSLFNKFDVKAGVYAVTQVPANFANSAKPSPQTSNLAKLADRDEADFQRKTHSFSDDDLALAIAALVSPFIAEAQIKEAWDSMTWQEEAFISGVELKRIDSMPRAFPHEQKEWVNAYLAEFDRARRLCKENEIKATQIVGELELRR